MSDPAATVLERQVNGPLTPPSSRVGRDKKEGHVDRDKMLEVTLQQIEKQHGRGAVMKLGEHPMNTEIMTIPTGSLALDIALGIGGIPRGRVVEVFGPEGSGKTTVCLHIIAEAQRQGGIAAFIDAEHALDPTYARELGVNIDELLVSQPDSGEQALEIADMLVRSGALSLVVIDSVAALVPRAEIEGEMGDTHVGLQARLMSQAMRKLSGSLSKFETTAIFINQLREKIGVMFGSPETTPGGRALKFYSSVRLDVRKIENLKDGTEVVGSRTRVKVVKNKVAPPFRQCEFDIMYGKGISKEGSLIDVGVDLEIIKKSGAWFTYEGEQLGQGKENARAFLAEHTDIRDEIELKVRRGGRADRVHRGRRPADPDRARSGRSTTSPHRTRQGRQEGRLGGVRRPRSRPRASGRTSTSGRSGSLRCGNAAAGSSSAGSSRPGSSPTRSPTSSNASSGSVCSTTRPSRARSSRAGWGSEGNRAGSWPASSPRPASPATWPSAALDEAGRGARRSARSASPTPRRLRLRGARADRSRSSACTGSWHAGATRPRSRGGPPAERLRWKPSTS